MLRISRITFECCLPVTSAISSEVIPNTPSVTDKDLISFIVKRFMKVTGNRKTALPFPSLNTTKS